MYWLLLRIVLWCEVTFYSRLYGEFPLPEGRSEIVSDTLKEYFDNVFDSLVLEYLLAVVGVLEKLLTF
ncbi:hypothetical protein [Anaplasma phagocytophilum]|uniref:hypothetical protein n=1 Tax=Anaplasma phagocytophilum TaxID=948 RepID=UPI00201A4CC2